MDEPKIPDVLFDGYSVYLALSSLAKKRTSEQNVADVLGAVVRLMRWDTYANDRS